MKKLPVFILLISCFILISCKKEVSNIVKPTDYGNGVYYFPCHGEKFAKSLSFFLSDGTKYIQGITGDGSGARGSDAGFFVVIDLPELE